MKKIELHDAQYWVDRKLDSEKDWIDDTPNWIESYVNSANHPHRELILDAVGGLGSSSILEIGCNVGSNLIRIKEIFPEIKLAGLDISEICIKIAKGYLGGATLKVGTYFRIPFADKSFDTVLADATLMYANPKEIGRAMEEIDRVARRAVIIVDRFNVSRNGIRNGHVWARNYPLLLKDLGYKVKKSKIRKKDWPKSDGWQRFGMVIVGEKGG